MEVELFGPLKRAHVTQEVANAGHWSGTVQGLKIRFDLLPLKEGRCVAWSAEAPGWAQKGVAGTVFEAMDDIGGHFLRQEAKRDSPPVQGSLF